MVLPVVMLAEKIFVNAGSVVMKNVDVPCSLVVGVPAEIKKRLV